MKTILEKMKPLNNIFVLVLVFLLAYLLLIYSSISNHAMITTDQGSNFKQEALFQKDVTYTFNIADKLEGAGKVKLIIEGGELTGIASGVGSTCRGKVDLHSKMNGKVDKSSGNINLVISGIGDPVGVGIPGKVNFEGPIQGSLYKNKLRLSGNVDIDGWIASCAGFKKQEELVIEIADKTIIKMLKKATYKLAMR